MRVPTLLLVACGAASVATAQTSAPPEGAASEVPKEKKVCRSEPQLGSIMQKRTCHTRAEWATIDAVNQSRADRVRDTTRGPGAARAGGGGVD